MNARRATTRHAALPEPPDPNSTINNSCNELFGFCSGGRSRGTTFSVDFSIRHEKTIADDHFTPRTALPPAGAGWPWRGQWYVMVDRILRGHREHPLWYSGLAGCYVRPRWKARETLLYRGGVVSSAFITARLLPNNRFTPSREVLASLRGRRVGRPMMGSEGEAEQSEKRPAEAERCFPANSPRPSSPRGVIFRRWRNSVSFFTPPRRHRSPCANGIPYRRSTCGA